jgi:hypothetical protein
MDKLTKYRQLILAILNKYVKIQLANSPEIENELIIDEKGDHYQLIRLGFENLRRVHYCVFHFDIKNDKIWIQQDSTDIPVAQLLLDEGVPKEDIVLAFHAPYRRELSGFAVA